MDKKIAVISVSHLFPPHVGGIETFSYNLLSFFAKKQEIEPIALFASNSNFDKVEGNIRQISVKTLMLFKGLYPFATIGFAYKAFRLFRNKPNKIVIINGRHLTTSYISFLICRVLKIQYIYVDSGFQPNIFKSSFANSILSVLDKLFFIQIAYCAKDVIAISGYTKNILVKLHPGLKDKIQIINTGFNDDKVLKYSSSNKEKIVVFASRISEIKDPITTAKAFEVVSKNHLDWKFYLIGKGDFEINKKDYNFSENVEVINELLPQDELLKLLSKSSIYINSSLSEGFSLANQEALALGNVGVFSNADSNIEMASLVDIQDYIFTRKDPKDLAIKISKAIEDCERSNFENNKKISEKAIKRLSSSVLFEKYYELVTSNWK